MISLEGVLNFRDLGGHPTQHGGTTKPGLIYRSDSLHHLTPADRAKIQQLGLAIDLRWDEEITAPTEGISVLRIPAARGDIGVADVIHQPDFDMTNFYVAMLDYSRAFHARVLSAVVHHLDKPLVIHCASGKDRTGIVAALLLRLANVPDAVIAADYALSHERLLPRLPAQKQKLLKLGWPEAGIENLQATPPERILAVLQKLDTQYGSVENYLTAGGATPALITQFREQFVEDKPWTAS